MVPDRCMFSPPRCAESGLRPGRAGGQGTAHRAAGEAAVARATLAVGDGDTGQRGLIRVEPVVVVTVLEDRAGDLEKILGNRPEIKISGGYPANVLLEASQEVQPSLVAVGSRGLAGLIRTRLGSVSTKVVTAARGPVLVYPHVE